MSTPLSRRLTPYTWFIVILGLLIAIVLFYRFESSEMQLSQSSELRRMSVVPSFSFTERSGKTVSNQDLIGKIWVADFIYTTCPGPCPLISASMARVQNALANDPHVQLVSFTVDPEHDTPDVLAKYADQYGASPDHWWFLTGPKKPMRDLIQNGFLQVVEDNTGQPSQPGQFTIMHSTYMALVDAEGNVRGFYDGVESDGRADLLRDIKVLEKEEKP
ncbi:MAG: SCO family protein [Methylacidiphilales bacterium]|nr:SCO family protein [Candidatus Methylacidiphilales bacterium]